MDYKEMVIANEGLQDAQEQLEFAVEAAELGTWDYNPATNKFRGNERLKKWFGLSADAEIDLGVALGVVISNDRDRVHMAISEALKFESGGRYDIEYSIRPIGTRDERRVLARGVAHFNKQGVPIRLNGTLQDITQITELRKKTEASEHNLRNIILQTPVGMAMLKGPSFIVDIANEPMLELWGKTSADVTGKPLANGIPDAKDVGIFEDLLQNVFLTGERYVTLERKVKLMKFNKPEYKYLNLVYQVLREDDTTILE